jgi:predicted transcriptional regulator
MSAVIENRSALEQPVSSVLEAPCPTLDGHADVSEAVNILKSTPMLVVQEFGKITGVLTRHDVLQYL